MKSTFQTVIRPSGNKVYFFVAAFLLVVLVGVAVLVVYSITGAIDAAFREPDSGTAPLVQFHIEAAERLKKINAPPPSVTPSP